MSTRQAIRFIVSLLLLSMLSACAVNAALPQEIPTAEPTGTPTPIPTVSAPKSPTPTPVSCKDMPGSIRHEIITTTSPEQDFIIYLPPCYEESTDHYPVLYLLHGQTYTQDQWLRIGAATVADEFIHDKKSSPFILVFPDDHYWYVPAGAAFGERFISSIIPYVDANYRTKPQREFRALGGLSRGGGWAAQLGYERPDLFGAVGLHSPAFFRGHIQYIENLIIKMPEDLRPKLWHDIGEADLELGNSLLFNDMLMEHDYIHAFYRFKGDHTEKYWSAHIRQYFNWYTRVWAENSANQ